jgi:hypothetical protein
MIRIEGNKLIISDFTWSNKDLEGLRKNIFLHSKSGALRGVRVRFSPPAPIITGVLANQPKPFCFTL